MNPDFNPPLEAAAPVQLDAQALARLRDLDPEGRHGVLTRVLKAFETSLRRMQSQLRAELDAPNADVVSGVVHTLKSSSASVGALDLAKACAEVEAKLRRGDSAGLREDLVRLMATADAALQAVAAILRP